ncbi:UNVERIFIED_CONTAM: hypothetical protein Slati_1733600 [Sesamum latifolium]|uniref:Uncharacterized protein n=1 Tax=Sesamum latifolium TaxID=2727402 RepID=A0AAW2X070_9LAMI
MEIQEIKKRNNSMPTKALGTVDSWIPTIFVTQLAPPIRRTCSKLRPDLQAPARQQTYHRDQLLSSDKGGSPRSRHDFCKSRPSYCSSSHHRWCRHHLVTYRVYWHEMRKLFVREMLSNNNLQAMYVPRKEEVAKGGTINEQKRDKLGAQFRDKVLKLVDFLGKPNVFIFFPILAKFDVRGIEKEMRALMPSVEEILDTVIVRGKKTF